MGRRWRRFVEAHIVADNPMDDEALRWRHKTATGADASRDGVPPPSHLAPEDEEIEDQHG